MEKAWYVSHCDSADAYPQQRVCVCLGEDLMNHSVCEEHDGWVTEFWVICVIFLTFCSVILVS